VLKPETAKQRIQRAFLKNFFRTSLSVALRKILAKQINNTARHFETIQAVAETANRKRKQDACDMGILKVEKMENEQTTVSLKGRRQFPLRVIQKMP
jgi:ferritin-like metal-binding protein YciE